MSAQKFVVNKKIVFWSSVSLFIMSYIFLTLQTVASGSKYALLEKEEREISKKIRELNTEVMSATSLTQINEKSEQLGFLKVNDTLYIDQKSFVAKLP